jgi:hypothetical protein
MHCEVSSRMFEPTRRPSSNRFIEENPLSTQQSQRSQSRRSSSRRAMSGAGLALTALAVAACGGGSNSTASTAGTPSPSASPGAGFNANFGAVSGKILSISSAGAAVQSTSATTTVAWASSTQFSKVSAVTLSSLAKGDCVTVATGAKPGTAAAKTITATSVSVTSTSGCSQRGGGFGRGGFPGGNGTPPSGAPGGGTTSPSPQPTGSPGSRGGFGRGGFPGRGGRGFGGTLGTIASISNSSFVVKSAFGSTNVSVKTTSSTTFTATSTATSAAIVTGQCASAIGSKTSNGTIDARTITISSPQNGKCTNTGIGGFPGGGFGGGFGGGRGGFGSSPPVTSA